MAIGSGEMNAMNYSKNLQECVDRIRDEQGAQVELDDVASLVHSLMSSVEGDISAGDLKVHKELESMLEYIRRAKSEIAAIQPDKLRDEHIATATDELDAVVSATEEAAGTFMDVAEEIEELAGTSDEAAADKLRNISTRIFEASNFQDITGQRINKVVNAMRHIEARIERLALIVAGEEVPADLLDDAETDEDMELLNGPSMPDQANSQEDIDALLASFD
jgi:chemotaxis protein CheZ